MESPMIQTLVIETTRRCNYRCSHCLRGAPELVDFDVTHLGEILQGCGFVSMVTLSGGEPSLVVPVLREIRETFVRFGVEYGDFYVATNGYGKNDPEFVLEMMQWYLGASEKECSQIALSNTPFHKGQWGDRDKREPLGLLGALKFADFRENENEREASFYPREREWLREGRAARTAFKNRHETRVGLVDKIQLIEGDTVEGDVYLNCSGNVINGCDLSYASQKTRRGRFSTAAEFWTVVQDRATRKAV